MPCLPSTTLEAGYAPESHLNFFDLPRSIYRSIVSKLYV